MKKIILIVAMVTAISGSLLAYNHYKGSACCCGSECTCTECVCSQDGCQGDCCEASCCEAKEACCAK